MQTTHITESEFDFTSYCKVRRDLVELKLTEYLSGDSPDKLWESMRYSVLSGGKRLRALLCIAAGEAIIGLNTDLELFIPCSCALEMVHAMSLIHDDLPVLDNDDYRRGKLTNHKVYGEAMALLAGDALLMLAIETLIEKTPESIKRSLLLEVVSQFCRATGAAGMVGGQVLDLSFTGKLNEMQSKAGKSTKLETDIIEAIHKCKTGALIQFAIGAGAKLAGGSDKQLFLLEQFADKLGFAFQIADDLLDITGNLKTLGKTPGKDLAANKVTWVTVFGEKPAREKLQELEQESLHILDDAVFIAKQVKPLKELLKFAIHRTN